MWTHITPPPPGYIAASCCSYPSGLFVVLLVQQTNHGYEVIACVDHGTPQSSVDVQGSVATMDEAWNLVAQCYAMWDEHQKGIPPSHAPRRRWFYEDKGGISKELRTREELLALLASGVVTWGAAVWERTEGYESNGWESLRHAMCLPED